MPAPEFTQEDIQQAFEESLPLIAEASYALSARADAFGGGQARMLRVAFAALGYGVTALRALGCPEDAAVDLVSKFYDDDNVELVELGDDDKH